ncbi:hypothetical protein FOZ61_001531, partial [Perkinsus olseni]
EPSSSTRKLTGLTSLVTSTSAYVEMKVLSKLKGRSYGVASLYLHGSDMPRREAAMTEVEETASFNLISPKSPQTDFRLRRYFPHGGTLGCQLIGRFVDTDGAVPRYPSKGYPTRDFGQGQIDLSRLIPPGRGCSGRQDLKYRLRVREDLPGLVTRCRDNPADCFQNSKEFAIRNSSVGGELPEIGVDLYGLTINDQSSAGLDVLDYRAIREDGILLYQGDHYA